VNDVPRRRRKSSHAAILAATRELIRDSGYPALTIEAIAARAGVGKQTIYRWWPSKGAVAVEALLDEVEIDIDFPDTGDLAADLESLLASVAKLLADVDTGVPLVALLAETQRDDVLRTIFMQEVFRPIRGRYAQRIAAAQAAGALSAHLDQDAILDCAFGPLWFRALTRPSELNAQFGSTVAHLVLNGAHS
jgi:AcrR family transcriptional regulator